MAAFHRSTRPTEHLIPGADWLGPCLLWTGPTGGDGYGVFRWRGASVPAHLFAALLVDRPRPPRWATDHLCHAYSRTCGGGPACQHRVCVAAAHLEHISPVLAGRRVAARSPYGEGPPRTGVWPSCRAGHPFLPGCYRYRQGRRECFFCAGAVELSEDWRELAASGYRLF